MRPTDPKVTLSGTKLRETDKAVQFQVVAISGNKLEKEITTWFPFSQMEKSFTSPDSSSEDWIIVSEWIVKQKPGLAEYLDHSDPVHNLPPTKLPPTQRTRTPAWDGDDIPF